MVLGSDQIRLDRHFIDPERDLGSVWLAPHTDDMFGGEMLRYRMKSYLMFTVI